MTVHRFEEGDDEVWHWTNVYPGDVVLGGCGAMAFKYEDFDVRNKSDTRVFRLKRSTLFVIARIDGIPGDEHSDHKRTFVVNSRHGILIVFQDVKKVEGERSVLQKLGDFFKR